MCNYIISKVRFPHFLVPNCKSYVLAPVVIFVCRKQQWFISFLLLHKGKHIFSPKRHKYIIIFTWSPSDIRNLFVLNVHCLIPCISLRSSEIATSLNIHTCNLKDEARNIILQKNKCFCFLLCDRLQKIQNLLSCHFHFIYVL